MTLYRTLPIGRRDGLAASKTELVSTPSPDSKIAGDVILLDTVKMPNRRAINPLAPLSSKPPGAFEAAYNGREISRVDFRGANQERLRTEQADRIARTRSAPTVSLGTGPTSGWDWIRFGRRIAPTLPGGFRGQVATVKAHGERGTLAQQLEMPILTTQGLATDAQVAAVDNRNVLPTGHALVPHLTAPVLTTTTEAPPPTPFDWAYLIGALVVVFLILKVAR